MLPVCLLHVWIVKSGQLEGDGEEEETMYPNKFYIQRDTVTKLSSLALVVDAADYL